MLTPMQDDPTNREIGELKGENDDLKRKIAYFEESLEGTKQIEEKAKIQLDMFNKRKESKDVLRFIQLFRRSIS